MAKKLKDYYDKDLVIALASRLKTQTPGFNQDAFIKDVCQDLESLEFTARQVLIAKGLHQHLQGSYRDRLHVFEQILGPELKTSIGMFSEGYWLWPIGKYVEIYGQKDFTATTNFCKALTKRHTGEFAIRPLVLSHPKEILALMSLWCKDEDNKVRRLASECLRINLPWAKKSTLALDYFEDYRQILTQLKDDSDKSVQKSVANNLNDLSKYDLGKFQSILADWQNGPISPACAWIIRHGSRSLQKKQKR